MKKILIIALIIRLAVLIIFRNIDNYDLQSYQLVGKATAQGINIYPKIANLHYPYFPFYLILETIAFKIKQPLFLKSINIIFDLAIIYLVYLLSHKNKNIAFIYAINPVTILIFVLHGQFDAIPIFFLLLSLYLVTLRVTRHEKLWTPLGCLTFSLAVMSKTWPLLFVVVIYKRLKNKKIVVFSLFFPILSVIVYCLIFKSSPLNILQSLIYYQGIFGIWGISKIFSFISLRLRYQKLVTFTFLLIFFYYSYKIKEKNLIKKIYLLLLFFFSFTPTFSIQYLSWLIPFSLITFPKYIYQLIFLITFYLLSFYTYWIFCSNCTVVSWLYKLPQEILGLILWLTFIKWWYIEKNFPSPRPNSTHL